ncbi:MAG: hypothetical protein ACSHUF_00445 [Candidatus Nasuia deltocephalinicola]
MSLLKIIKKKYNYKFLKKGKKINLKIKNEKKNKDFIELKGTILKIKKKSNQIIKIEQKLKGCAFLINIPMDSPLISKYEINNM